MIRKALFLFLTFAAAVQGANADLVIKENVRQRLHELVKIIADTSYLRDAGRADEEYREALRALGALVDADVVEQAKASEPSLQSELLLISHAYFTRPDQIDHLSAWYGRVQAGVPRELRGIKNDEVWKSLQRRFRINHVPLVEHLHAEHSVEEFRFAWELWLLAPGSAPKSHMILRILEALSAIQNPHSIPVLVRAFEKAANDNAFRTQVSFGEDWREQLWAIMHVIKSFRSEVALDALLSCRDIALKHDLGPGPGSAMYYVKDKTFDESFRRLLTATRPDPEAPPFDDQWKDYLVIIEKRLKKGDLSPDKQSVLRGALSDLRRRAK